eukprot:3186649-Pleurochrysis_carterae.AAC.1
MAAALEVTVEEAELGAEEVVVAAVAARAVSVWAKEVVMGLAAAVMEVGEVEEVVLAAGFVEAGLEVVGLEVVGLEVVGLEADLAV